jgi:tetratricopeptide (TPR) repeat protein
MSRYHCPHCDQPFEHDVGPLRCPRCLRQHGLEAPRPSLTRSNRPRRALLLGVSGLLGLLVVSGLLLYRRPLPRPGELALLDASELQRTLRGRGVPPAALVDPFAGSLALRQLARAEKKDDPAALAAALARRLAGKLGRIQPDLEGAAETPALAASELYAQLLEGKVRTVTSFELSALMVALLREADLQAVLGLASRLRAPMPTPLPGVGRYVVMVYKKDRLGRELEKTFDPLAALPLPSWAGKGNDAEMTSAAEGPVPLDDGSAAAHLLALRAYALRKKAPARAYELSLLALHAASPCAQLLLLRAEILASAGGTEDAVAEARKALALSDDAATRTSLAHRLAEVGRLEEAVAKLEGAVSLDGAYWPAHATLASWLLPTQPEKALKHLEQGLKIAPDAPALLMLQAMIALQENNLERAISLLRKVTDRQPSLPGLLLLYQSLALAGDTQETPMVRRRLLALASDRKKMEQTLDSLDQLPKNEEPIVPGRDAALPKKR